MQKIMTTEEKEQKEARSKLIIGIILVGIMVLSSAGYAFYHSGGTEGKIKFNGIEFLLGEDKLWHFQISGQEFSTASNPQETENVSIDMNITLQNYAGKDLYFSDDSDMQGAGEISRNIGGYVPRMQQACLEACEEDLPLKNCTDNVIAIMRVNETLIKQEDNCIYILAKDEDIMRASDAFVFRLLGVS